MDWLNQKEDRPDWFYVWRALLKYPTHLPPEISQTDLLQVGLNWLKPREDRPSWAYIWETLLEYPNQLPNKLSKADLLLDFGLFNDAVLSSNVI